MIPTLPQAIRFHRRKAGLSQTALAKVAGIGKTAVFDMEKGKKTIRLETLMRALEVLNISLQWSSPIKDEFTQLYAQQSSERNKDEKR